jgi:tRNA dimethylallyltransferase
MYDRINQRVAMMLNEGLLTEAKALYPNKQLNALQTVGYRELFDYFDATIEDSKLLENAIEQIKMNTRRFSKRQMTWFKRTENVSWFDFLTDRDKILSIINSKMKK